MNQKKRAPKVLSVTIIVTGLIILSMLHLSLSEGTPPTPKKTVQTVYDETFYELDLLILNAYTVMSQAGDTLTDKDREKLEKEFKKLDEMIEDAREKIPKAISEKESEIDSETDPKKKKKLEGELEVLERLKEKVTALSDLVKHAIANISTITREGAEATIQAVTQGGRVIQTVIETITGAAKATLKAALDIYKSVLKTVTQVLRGILRFLGDTLRFAWGFVRGLFGLFSLSSSTDLSMDGVHTLEMQASSYLDITLPTLDPNPNIVYFHTLTFRVSSAATEVPNLRLLTVDSTYFYGLLEPFTVNEQYIGPSVLILDPNITWTGVYDTNDQSVYITLGGYIVNDYTPLNSPMIFSLTMEGPIESLNVTGSTLEPFPPAHIPSLTQWGLIILLIVLAGVATWVVLKRRRMVTT